MITPSERTREQFEEAAEKSLRDALYFYFDGARHWEVFKIMAEVEATIQSGRNTSLTVTQTSKSRPPQGA